MAAGTLPAPGTPVGPCPAPCPHRDCAATRQNAESECPLCDEPIGYDRRFYNEGDHLVHAACLEADVLR